MSTHATHAPHAAASSVTLAVVEAHASFLASLQAGGASAQSLRVHDQAVTRFAEYLRPRTLLEATESDTRAFTAYLAELGVTPSSLTAYGTVLTRWLAHLDGSQRVFTPPPVVIACESLVDSEVASCMVPVVAVEPDVAPAWAGPTPADAVEKASPDFERVEMPVDAYAFGDETPMESAQSVPSVEPGVDDVSCETLLDATPIEPLVHSTPPWMAPPEMKLPMQEAPAPTERLEVTGNDEPSPAQASASVTTAGDDAPSWNEVAGDDEAIMRSDDAHPVQDFSRPERAAPAARGDVAPDLWSVQVTGSVMTDLTLVAVRKMAQRGEISLDTRVRRADGKWMRAEDFAPLRHVLEEAHLDRAKARGRVGRGLFWSIGGALIGALVASLGAWFTSVSLGHELTFVWAACGPVVAWLTSRVARPSMESGVAAAAGTLATAFAAQYFIFSTISAGVGTRVVDADVRDFGGYLFTSMTPTSWGMVAIGCALAFLLGRWRR